MKKIKLEPKRQQIYMILRTLKEREYHEFGLTAVEISKLTDIKISIVRTLLTSLLLPEGYVTRQLRGYYKLSDKGIRSLQELSWRRV